jgi:ABC-type polar amino acid transport system ATPase subunit
MNALESVSEGIVEVNGFAAHDRSTDLNKMRESVGMVFQRFNLFPHMTVLENLIMAPDQPARREPFAGGAAGGRAAGEGWIKR